MAKKKKKRKKAIKRIPYEITDGITQSILNTFMTCRQQAKFYLDGWRTYDTSDAMRFGSLFHWLLQELYDAVRTGEEVALGRVTDLLEKYETDQQQISSSITAIQKLELDLAMAEALILPYMDHYPEDFTQKRWEGVESEFANDWNGFLLRGKMDGIYQVKKSYWLLETKTKSRIEEGTLSDALAFDFQNLFYLLNAEIMLGKPIKGVLYNIVRRPSLRQKQLETMGEFCARIKQDVLDKPEHYFKRFEIVYDKDTRKQFAQELKWKLRDFKAWSRGEIPTYKNETACTAKWTCRYLSACASGRMAGYHQNGKLFEELSVSV